MFVCQWHLDIVYGKQAEALRVMREWGKEKFAHSDFGKATGSRMMTGFIGPSASHVVDEYYFQTLADFESGLRGMQAERFRKHSDALAPYIVPGSQHWEILRVLD